MSAASIQFIMKTQSSSPKEPDDTVDWAAELCQESAIHGMPYVSRRDLHWTERLFWVSIVLLSAYYAISSCLSQWNRFRDNPIVFQYEYLFGLRKLPAVGVTLCTTYEDQEHVNQVINETWGLGPSNEKTAYYEKFLFVLNRLQYNKLDTLTPYENDSTLDNLNYVGMLMKLQEKVLMKDDELIVAPVITEVGLCQTTSQLNRYGNPYGKIENMTVVNVIECEFNSNCRLQGKPFNGLNTTLKLYFHDVNEFMLPHDLKTLHHNAKTDISFTFEFLVNSISAENDVRNLPLAYRKCRYKDEDNLEYYSPYYQSLCRLECRVKWALSLCNCKPFFYVAAVEAPVCNIRGMLCLHRSNWLEKPCECLPPCIENTYAIFSVQEQKAGNFEAAKTFERTLIFKMDLPKMGMKRRVVFSTDQLIMSFGGAIGLFLGASFMTIYGLVYLFLCFFVHKCKQVIQKRFLKKNLSSANINAFK
ncbi:uncharacterized protein LOC108112605 [Drosophila eugracilis]|uniref:uncharacterized protein LOC108112605 n=1 Tax=Drosophila eugracilis TaxID=29029 RepID=UPI0007E78ED9|nr:uncharacterized protein LOC108112605 [Drosophila eugracilis]